MAPTFLLRDGRPWLALGSPGGPTIVTAILQTLLGLLDDGLGLEAVVAAPRYFAGQYPRFTWEKGLPAETLAELRDLGHRPSRRPIAIGGVQAIMIDPESGRRFGVADPRREGAVIEVDTSMVSGPWLFRDRLDAGARLAEHLGSYHGKDALVLGIPRGGVLVAGEVARRLEAEIDVIVARKLGAPNQPELAIGAVTPGGRWLNERIIREREVSEAYLEAVTAEQMAEARRRNERFRGGRRMSRVKGRIVIVVDDGLATGATVRAALRSLRAKRPARLVVAAPVGSQRACASLREEADEVVCPHELRPFTAVGRFYERFDQTEDAQVERVLREARGGGGSARRRRGPKAR
jgi:predicted phosphoribosyltransferase